MKRLNSSQTLLRPSLKCVSYGQCGWTPLMIAASAGREQVVRLMIGRGANINTRNNGGHSALQYAASKDHYEVRIKTCYWERGDM